MTDLLADAETPEPGQPAKESVPTFDESGDNLTIDYHGPYLGTKDEFLAECGIDLAIWEIERIVANGWEVTGKKKADGEDRIWKSRNKQIRCYLKRKAPRSIQLGIQELVAGWRPLDLPAVEYPAIEGERFMCELSLYDVHIGKLCWGVHTGTDYDAKIAVETVRNAAIDLGRRTNGFPIEQFVLPLGHDWFHTDNWHGTTESGTVVETTDDRGPKIFKTCVQLAAEIIRMLRRVAPVHIVYVVDNHGPSAAWHMLCVLEQIFADDTSVTFDLGPQERKYFSYGPALIGMAHGHGVKLDKLPLIMAVEAPEQWAKAKHRHIHTGHLHKKAKKDFVQWDTFNGVEVLTLPSLSGTDSWHFKNGFVGNVRAAEAYLWSNQEGYAGHFSVNARSN